MQEQIQAVQRMQEYIETHLCEKITFADLAKASLFSPWYARRLFLEFTGVTPADYIRKLRLKQSALKLRDEDVKILDVALDFGFGSVDGYQRAFRKEFGCNPGAYAANPVPLPLFTPYGVKFRFLERKEKVMSARNVFIQLIDKPKRKVILKRGKTATEYWSYCEEVGCDVWGVLVSMKSLCGEPVCLWLPKKYILPGTSEYVQGVEVPADYCGEIPDGFDSIELPAAKYLMFQGEPFKEEAYEQAITDIWEAEKKYDPAMIVYRWDDENPKIQLEPIGTRGYIELLPIKE
ncbi:MAG: helix-turn-helix domain-containing protein [Oscillospiraceae bacterium]|nr:helix-turn-helix domain-containing protein [Oscillospiraceae bacterium]